MARCYSDAMEPRQPLPPIWLISDSRNDAVLETTLARLPRGSGFVFRHYHLATDARRARFDVLVRQCRTLGHMVILADSAEVAAAWQADGAYGRPDQLGPPAGLLRLAAAHDAEEIAVANRANADGIFLSPVFATRSHPDGHPLGPDRFRALAALANAPVIALGGMNAARAAELDWPRWAAIDAFLR